jgi:uncharacterized membrane protein
MSIGTSHVEAEPAGNVERWGALATASALFVYGASRRSIPGVCVAAAATPFAYRGIAGRWPTFFAPLLRSDDDTRVALAGERGVHVREAIRLEKPLAEVYAFWRRFENLPRFMSHLEDVTQLSDGRSQWVAKGPGRLRVEWNAEIINEVENQVIGWRSTSTGSAPGGVRRCPFTFSMPSMYLATDRPHALRQAIAACRKGGTVSIPGVYGGWLDKFPLGAAFAKGLTLKMGQTHMHKYMPLLLDRIERGEIDPSFIVTHRVTLDDAPRMYQTFREKQDDCIKVVMKPA